MTIPTPKFDVGDVVFEAWAEVTRRRLTCPDCADTKRVQLVTHQETLEAECPRCARFRLGDIEPLEVIEHAPKVNVRTIGSVQINTHDSEAPVRYMMEETGVGSGQVYSEDRLHATQEEAQADAERRAWEADAALPEEQENRRKRAHEVAAYPLTMAIKDSERRLRYEVENELRRVYDDIEALANDMDRRGLSGAALVRNLLPEDEREERD